MPSTAQARRDRETIEAKVRAAESYDRNKSFRELVEKAIARNTSLGQLAPEVRAGVLRYRTGLDFNKQGNLQKYDYDKGKFIPIKKDPDKGVIRVDKLPEPKPVVTSTEVRDKLRAVEEKEPRKSKLSAIEAMQKKEDRRRETKSVAESLRRYDEESGNATAAEKKKARARKRKARRARGAGGTGRFSGARASGGLVKPYTTRKPKRA
jgi:hypothetical protein